MKDVNSTSCRMALGLFTVLISQICAAEYGESEFKSDWSSPLTHNRSRETLVLGTSLTVLLVATRTETINPVGEYFVKHEPLGEASKYGDYAGQMLPNLFYMGLMYSQDTPNAIRRSQYMFKTTLFSGLSVFFLKRIINQQRPDGGDRNSHPSGHTTTAFAFASVISHEHPRWSLAAYALASFVGLSRLNDNVHYLHDVVMGATIGMAYGQAFAEETSNNVRVFPLLIPRKTGLIVQFDY